MKFRELKKKKFYWYFSEVWYIEYPDKHFSNGKWWDTMPESYVVNDEDGLHLYAYWEDDREYCGGSGYTKEKYSWKELKKTIKEQGSDRQYNHIKIWDGKCKRCNCNLTKDNYEYKLDFSMVAEDDIYYCNYCKQKQIDDMVAWFEQYEKEHSHETSMYI